VRTPMCRGVVLFLRFHINFLDKFIAANFAKEHLFHRHKEISHQNSEDAVFFSYIRVLNNLTTFASKLNFSIKLLL